MGAQDFSQLGHGKDLNEAFKYAQEQAFYWHGHGGYTGSLAEKQGAIRFIRPKGMSYARFKKAFETLGYTGNTSKVNPKYREFYSKVWTQYDEKWGAAVAIELDGPELRKYKEANGLMGKHGLHVYEFMGIASS